MAPKAEAAQYRFRTKMRELEDFFHARAADLRAEYLKELNGINGETETV